MKLKFILLFGICSISFLSFGQVEEIAIDTLEETPVDTVLIRSYTKRFNPHKALFYSAIIPGLGQIYNKKYWKVPLVYGGFYAGYLIVNHYQSDYLDYKQQLFTLLNDPNLKTSAGLTKEQLRTIINKAQRQRDFWCILTGVWYMLQMVDAHVDAHLKEFDVNPQLKVSVEPMMESDQLIGRSSGFSIKLKF